MYNNKQSFYAGGGTVQREILNEKSIFDASGKVSCAGWSREPNFHFDKSLAKNRFTLNEKDSYLITGDGAAIYLSVAEKGINAEVTAVIIDLNSGEQDFRTLKKYMSLGRLSMPASSKNGDVTFTDTRVGMNFSNTALNRYIRCEFVDFCKEKTLYINLELKENPCESLNIMIPSKNNPKSFFLKRFMPYMSATGVVRCGGAEYNLTKEDSFAYLDWQRYSLSEKSCYHALYANTEINGRQFALCLAGGVGDTSLGSENCFFLDGEIHKFASVKATGKEERPDKPWKFTAGSSAMELTFKPSIKSGKLLCVTTGGKTLVFGELYGYIKQIDTERLLLDAVPAHMEFSII